MLGEGLPAETYLDTGYRATSLGASVVMLYPDFVDRTWEMKGCAQLVMTGERLEAARATLARHEPLPCPPGPVGKASGKG